MELEYEHIDWNDIADAELSGDQEALRKLRDRAAEIKLQAKTPISDLPCQPSSIHTKEHEVERLLHHNGGAVAQDVTNYVNSKSKSQHDYQLEEYPLLSGGTHSNKENTVLPFATFSPCSSKATTSYAQVVNRNPKRTLVDRCLSPSEVPLKRPVTSDIMTTPTENKMLFYQDLSPTCETTPETNSLPGKAGLVQRRLFETQPPEQKQPQPTARPTDSHRLAQRQKQVDFGKNTLGYERYIQMVPKWKRQRTHPVTPDKYNLCSTRSWQGQIRVWRRQLHKYDPTPEQTFTPADASLCDVSYLDDH